jgi:hypothetical protein
MRHYTQIWLRWQILATSRNVVHLGALVPFRFIFTLKEASLEHDECELRFESKKPSTFCFVFSGRALSSGLEIAILTSSCFRFFHCTKWGTVEFWILPSWVLHHGQLQWTSGILMSVMRFPPSFYKDVQRFGSRSVRFNAEECSRRQGAEACSRGKFRCSFCYSLQFVVFALVVFVCFCFVCFRSRSYPVPHRGERVKQRTVHARNVNNCCICCKALHFS